MTDVPLFPFRSASDADSGAPVPSGDADGDPTTADPNGSQWSAVEVVSVGFGEVSPKTPPSFEIQ